MRTRRKTGGPRTSAPALRAIRPASVIPQASRSPAFSTLSGRELRFGKLNRIEAKEDHGGGGGPRHEAAVVAASRTRVTLYGLPAGSRQALLLSCCLIGRFGGLVTNLTRELELAQVISGRTSRSIVRWWNANVRTLWSLHRSASFKPTCSGEPSRCDAWEVLNGKAEVAIGCGIDWRCTGRDRHGGSFAREAARTYGGQRHHAGESIPLYVVTSRTPCSTNLCHRAALYRLYGCDDHTFICTYREWKPIEIEGVDTLVLCTAIYLD